MEALQSFQNVEIIWPGVCHDTEAHLTLFEEPNQVLFMPYLYTYTYVCNT